MNRRGFLSMLGIGAAAAIDPERLIWTPGFSDRERQLNAARELGTLAGKRMVQQVNRCLDEMLRQDAAAMRFPSGSFIATGGDERYADRPFDREGLGEL